MHDLLSANGLIAAEDLYFLMGENKNIRILDSTYGSVRGISHYQAFLGGHIEGAQFFDIDTVADQDSPLPHMAPDAEYFADCVSSMGISNGDHVIIYDQSGFYMASTRAWWLFRLFGHENVYILDGGLRAWKSRGYKIEEGPAAAPPPAQYSARFNPALYADKEQLLKNIDSKEVTIIDARPLERFHAVAPEPRSDMRSGHIPGSINIPITAFIDPREGCFKSDEEIESIFEQHDIAYDRKIAASCGSGITACTIAFALYKTRRQSAAVYDGSWAEWGQTDADTPVEV